jgi:hypothetical protein
MVGCYLPEGTKKITGGTGKSVDAESLLVDEQWTDTVVSATVKITVGEQTEEINYLASGKVDLVDHGQQVHIKSDIEMSAFVEDLEDLPVLGLAFFGYCSYQVGGGKPELGYVQGFVFEVDEEDTPHGTVKVLAVQVFDLNDSFLYTAYANFLSGSFVFHGQNGKPLK